MHFREFYNLIGRDGEVDHNNKEHCTIWKLSQMSNVM